MSFILQHIEKTVNEILQNDPDLLANVTAMNDKIMAIELIGPGKTLYILPTESGIHLQSAHDGDVHVRIKGTPLGLLKMAGRRDNMPATFDGDVEISGDLALGQHLQRMIREMDLDWEELLSQKVGDVAAHQIGNFLRGFSNWAKDVHESMEQNISEYLRIEAGLTPDRTEIEQFIHDVDTLRQDVDRLEQRIARLKRA